MILHTYAEDATSFRRTVLDLSFGVNVGFFTWIGMAFHASADREPRCSLGERNRKFSLRNCKKMCCDSFPRIPVAYNRTLCVPASFDALYPSQNADAATPACALPSMRVRESRRILHGARGKKSKCSHERRAIQTRAGEARHLQGFLTRSKACPGCGRVPRLALYPRALYSFNGGSQKLKQN